MFKVEKKSHLKDFIGYMVIYCPDFPYRDFLPDDDQMTLNTGYDLLRKGLDIVYGDDCKAQLEKLQAQDLLEKSYTAFKEGDERTGRFVLQDFRASIFGPA